MRRNATCAPILENEKETGLPFDYMSWLSYCDKYGSYEICAQLDKGGRKKLSIFNLNVHITLMCLALFISKRIH